MPDNIFKNYFYPEVVSYADQWAHENNYIRTDLACTHLEDETEIFSNANYSGSSTL